MSAHGNPMELLVLSGADVRSLLSMAECIDLMQTTMATVSRGKALLPLRTAMQLPGTNNRLGVMPGYLAEPPAFGLKTICLFPGNSGLGHSSHMGLVLLFDPEFGQPRAVIDAAEITALRTAAASGSATRQLARPDAGDLAILGTGEQAGTHLRAMAAVRTLRRVRIWGRSAEQAKKFAAEHAGLVSCPIETTATVQAAVEGADLICTTTGAREPILLGAWIAPGAHVNLVGSSVPTSREVDDDAVVHARFFCDFRGSAHAQAGELLHAVEAGLVSLDHIVGEIGEVTNGAVAGRTAPEQITVYKSLGVAAQDLATAHLLHERARERGVGVRAPL